MQTEGSNRSRSAPQPEMETAMPGTDFLDVDSLLSDEEKLARQTARQFTDEQVLPVIVEANRAGGFNLAARQMTMAALAQYISTNMPLNFNRPVIDKTELSGAFDMKLDYTVTPLGARPQSADFQAVFTQALKNQLGLKLESTTGPVESLVIDHLEEPSPN